MVLAIWCDDLFTGPHRFRPWSRITATSPTGWPRSLSPSASSAKTPRWYNDFDTNPPPPPPFFARFHQRCHHSAISRGLHRSTFRADWRTFGFVVSELGLQVGGESNTSMTSNAYQIIANERGPSSAGADSPGSAALNIIPEQEITHGRKIGSGMYSTWTFDRLPLAWLVSDRVAWHLGRFCLAFSSQCGQPRAETRALRGARLGITRHTLMPSACLWPRSSFRQLRRRQGGRLAQARHAAYRRRTQDA